MTPRHVRLITSVIVLVGTSYIMSSCGSSEGTDTSTQAEVLVTGDATPDTDEETTTPTPDADGPTPDTPDTPETPDADSVPSEDTPGTPDIPTVDECQINADCAELASAMPCHVAVCEFGDCLVVQLSDNAACDDGNPCTADDFCTEGVCDGTEDGTAEGCAGVTACDEATVINAIPFTSASTTIDGAGYFAATDCPGPAEGKGGGSNEALYVMEVPESGTYVFALSDLEEDPEGLDAVLYLLDGCPGLGTSTCIAAQDIWYKHGHEELTISLAEGTQLFVVVDGYGSDANIEGNFELVVTMKEPPESDCANGVDDDNDGVADCADPGCSEATECLLSKPGALCANAIAVDGVPFLHEGTTTEMGNEVHIADETCPDAGDTEASLGMFGMASADVFFAFTPDSDGSYIISLDTEEDGDDFENLVLALYEGDCPSGLVTDICVMGDNAYNDGGELLVAELTAGTSYFVVIDGWGNDFDIHGAYQLRIEQLANVPPGALAITELMGNPDGEIADGSAEWIELRNTTTEEQSLKGLALTYRSWSKGDVMPDEPSNTWIIEEEASIAAGGTTVIAKSADTSVNGGLFVAVEYGSIGLTNNGAKSIALQLVKASWNGDGDPPAELIIDEVILPAGTFSGPGQGASFQLDEDRASGADAAEANDWAYRWCHTPKEDGFLYFAGNHGTPHLPNGACEGADGPPPMSFVDDIKPIYELRCIGCHTGGAGCLGGGCWDDYDDLLLDSYYCEGLTKGECTSVRIHEGSMPQSTGCTGDPEVDQDNAACLTAEEQQFLDWWIEGGMQP